MLPSHAKYVISKLLVGHDLFFGIINLIKINKIEYRKD
jgi:hypothetical protein